MLVGKNNKILDNKASKKQDSSVKPLLDPISISRKMMSVQESESDEEQNQKDSQALGQSLSGAASKMIDSLEAQISKSIGFTNKSNRSFRSYDQMFRNLLKYEYVDTQNQIMDAEISRDSTRTLCVTKQSEKEFWVKMYSLETLEMQFSE